MSPTPAMLGVDQLGIVGKVAGIYRRAGRCWRMIYSNAVGQPIHCNQPVTWRGRWVSPKGQKWWAVTACDLHKEGLIGLSLDAPRSHLI